MSRTMMRPPPLTADPTLPRTPGDTGRISAPRACRAAAACGLLAALRRDCSGASSVLLAISMSLLLGVTALGTEVSYWYFSRRAMQTAADAAATSAAVALSQGATAASLIKVGKAVAAQVGFTDGSDGVAVAVNPPPTSGAYATNPNAVEVIIARPQAMLLSVLFLGSEPTIRARSVALATLGFCLVALDSNASDTALQVGGTSSVSLSNCNMRVNANASTSGSSSISAYNVGIAGTCSGSITGTNKLACNTSTVTNDPYAGYVIPTPATPCSNIDPSTTEIYAGTYCGINVPNSSSLVLDGGLYIIDGGNLTIGSNSTLTSESPVTIVLTSSGSTYGTVSFGGGSTVSLTALPTGPTHGIAIWVDGNAPLATDTLGGGSNQVIDGAIYMPSQNLSYHGNASTSGCNQVVAYQINMTGSSSFTHNCSGSGVQEAGAVTQLVE